jgi:hypothetical protein
MSMPVFNGFVIVLTGWIFAPRRTITGTLIAAAVTGQQHHAAFHRAFSAARWSLDQLDLIVFELLKVLLPEGQWSWPSTTRRPTSGDCRSMASACTATPSYFCHAGREPEEVAPGRRRLDGDTRGEKLPVLYVPAPGARPPTRFPPC